MRASLALGHATSNGTYTPPAFQTPSTPTIHSSDRGRRIPIRRPATTPAAARRRARRLAVAFSSPYVVTRAFQDMAGRCGAIRPHASNASWMVAAVVWLMEVDITGVLHAADLSRRLNDDRGRS